MKPIAASAQSLLDSPISRDSASAPSRDSYCLTRAGMMYDCYRKSDAFNKQVFVAAAASILAEYDLDIVDYLTDPRTGLPSKLKWPPEPKEVRDACDEIVQDRKARADRDANLRQQFKERAEFEAEQADRPKHLSYAELIAKHGKNFGLDVDESDNEAAKKKARQFMSETNSRLLGREFAAAGMKPGLASPGLVALLKPHRDKK